MSLPTMRSFLLPRTLSRPCPHLLRLSSTRSPLTSPIPPTPYDPTPLPGTGPLSSSTLIVHLPIPPPHWPPKLEASPSIGPLATSLKESLRKHAEAEGGGGSPKELEGSVLFAWDGVGRAESLENVGGGLEARWYIPGKDRVDLYLPLPSLPPSSLSPAVSSLLSSAPSSVPTPSEDRLVVLPKLEQIRSSQPSPEDDPIEVYVCTHGQRDCRCADAGGALVDALREEIAKQGLEKRVQLFEVSHLGGHKWAANALIFSPSSSHLLGNLRPAHASLLLSSLFSPPLSPTNPLPRPLLPFWRGSPGMTKETMLRVYEAAMAEGEAEGRQKEKEGKVWEVVFETWEGEEVRRQGRDGESVMELGKREELGAMEGVCGGVLECATCHCFVPQDPYAPPVEEPSEMEDDMLSSAIMRKDSSRLGCQIKINEDLAKWCAAGGKIGLPRY